MPLNVSGMIQNHKRLRDFSIMPVLASEELGTPVGFAQ